MFSDYDNYDATGLAALLRAGEVSASEIVDTAIAKIEQKNSALNAIVSNCFERARSEAKNIGVETAFCGVPYLVKDLNTWSAGMPATNGSAALSSFVPQQDSELVARMRHAGLIIVGKTNTPEFGLNMCTSPALFGPTPNPFDASRSAGGSSGGSASAVASGIVPAAHATDSGGSIRIPASNCGLFGLKPTRSRVPLGNNAIEGLGGFSTGHAVTISVRDSARLLDVTQGELPGDIYAAPSSDVSFSRLLDNPSAKLRVALCTHGFAKEPIHNDCIAVTQNAAQRCIEIGHELEVAAPQIDGEALRQACNVIFSSNVRTALNTIVGADDRVTIDSLLENEQIEPATHASALAAQSLTATDYIGAQQVIHRVARQMGAFFERFDILLSPTLANPPLPLGTPSMQMTDWDEYLHQLLNELPFTPLFNAIGAPAMSVPLGRCSAGLPVGAHFGARFGNESALLQLARDLERAAPWHDRI